MRGQDLVRFLNAGQELPSWDCQTGSACLDIASATVNVQHVHWQPSQQTLGANTALQEADLSSHRTISLLEPHGNL